MQDDLDGETSGLPCKLRTTEEMIMTARKTAESSSYKHLAKQPISWAG